MGFRSMLVAAATFVVCIVPQESFATSQECANLTGSALQTCCTNSWAACYAGCALAPFPYSQEECEVRCASDYRACQNSNSQPPIDPVYPPSVPLSDHPYPAFPIELPSVETPTRGFWQCLGADGGWGEVDPSGHGGAGGGYIWLGDDRNCVLQIGGGGGENTNPYCCFRIQVNF